MIREIIKGDLLRLFKEEDKIAIAHGCNCFNNWDGGLSADLKEIAPRAFVADISTTKGSRSKLGTFSIGEIGRKIVFNLYISFDYRKNNKVNLDYNALAESIKAINDYCEVNGITTVYIPKIGTGSGNGDWDRVVTVINTNSPTLNIIVVEKEKIGE